MYIYIYIYIFPHIPFHYDLSQEFGYVDNSSRDGNTRPTLPAFWEIYMQVKKQQLEPDMEKQNGSKLGKEYSFRKEIL